jgi:Ca-activated chloride channel family protein
MTISMAAVAADKPLALAVETEPLGKGHLGTVVGIVVQVAPDDRDRLGERARVATSLFADSGVVDRQSAVVTLEGDGSALLYRDWKPGRYELRVQVAALESDAAGIWIGDIVVPERKDPFVAPEDASPDAVALELSPPLEGSVRFLPPPETGGGIGAIQLEVEAPPTTATVEFFHDDKEVMRRNRPPWTVSIPLGDIVRRSQVRAIARDSRGTFLGEDAIVLNTPTGQIGVEILLAPDYAIKDGMRPVTVSVTSANDLQQITLSLDDATVARWTRCPCVIELAAERISKATILAADATDSKGNRGDAILTIGGEGGFVGSIKVELVELPVLVLDLQGSPVAGLSAADFAVFEDEQPVDLEGFGTTADLPLSLAIAVDTSGSMTEVFPKVLRAVDGFAHALLTGGDEAVLLSFAWDATLQLDWTSDVNTIAGKLDRVVPEGGTSLHDAVIRSLEQFRGRRGRQALVLLTDGEDTSSRTGWDTARRYAHTMRVPIFPIGLGVGKLDFAGRKILRELASETGGTAFFPKDVEDLPGVYATIGELLRSQYLLWYSSRSVKPPEQFRSIRVEVARPESTVKTIRGYYPGK